jgi:hypothetical protein
MMSESPTSCALCHVLQELRIEAEEEAQQTSTMLQATEDANTLLQKKLDSLLGSYLELQREHNKMLKEVHDTKVRAQCTCRKLLLLLQRLYSTFAAVIPVLLLLLLCSLNCASSVLYMHVCMAPLRICRQLGHKQAARFVMSCRCCALRPSRRLSRQKQGCRLRRS